MERIGLIQVDGKMPNLALMKLSAFYKSQGYETILVDLSSFGIDKWFASKVFAGGSGYDIRSKLPEDVEELIPDYQMYNLDHSIGFTSRGCIRDCGFCIVNEKEGGMKEAGVEWIRHQKVIVLDNNFLASKEWRPKLEYFIASKMQVNFNQGLDIRLINSENAGILVRVNSRTMNFKKRRFTFAFDDISMMDLIFEKIKILDSAGFKRSNLQFYILCGYNSSHEEDMQRFNIVRGLGCVPYVMKFNDRKDDKQLNHFDRWVNGKYYQIMPFKDYETGLLDGRSRGKK